MIQINGFKVLGLICMLILAALGLIPFSSKDILTLISYALLAVIIIFAGWFLICRESPESGKNWLLTLPITALACYANLILRWNLYIPFFVAAMICVCTDASVTHIKKEDNPLVPVSKVYLSGMVSIILFVAVFALLGVYI